ncbi:MAG: hypothetical protein AAGI34_02140 [Pseudomonadota bacterium]
MGATRRWIMMAGLSAGLAGCSLFANDEEEVPEEPAPSPVLPREPVERIENAEIGRTRSGIALAVFAIAPGRGYTRPRLDARRQGRPAEDGFLEYDFVATPPEPPAEDAPAPLTPEPSLAARRIRADLLIEERTLRGVRGIRIFGLRGGLQLPF